MLYSFFLIIVSSPLPCCRITMTTSDKSKCGKCKHLTPPLRRCMLPNRTRVALRRPPTITVVVVAFCLTANRPRRRQAHYSWVALELAAAPKPPMSITTHTALQLQLLPIRRPPSPLRPHQSPTAAPATSHHHRWLRCTNIIFITTIRPHLSTTSNNNHNHHISPRRF